MEDWPCSLCPFLIVGLLLMAGFLLGCKQQPNPKSGESTIYLPGKKKPFHGAE